MKRECVCEKCVARYAYTHMNTGEGRGEEGGKRWDHSRRREEGAHLAPEKVTEDRAIGEAEMSWGQEVEEDDVAERRRHQATTSTTLKTDTTITRNTIWQSRGMR